MTRLRAAAPPERAGECIDIAGGSNVCPFVSLVRSDQP